MVVLGQRDQVALRRDLQTAASTDLDVRALKLTNERTVALKDTDVKAVAVRVAHEDVSSIADVDSVGKVGDVFSSHSTQVLPFVVENHYTVSLNKNKK